MQGKPENPPSRSIHRVRGCLLTACDTAGSRLRMRWLSHACPWLRAVASGAGTEDQAGRELHCSPSVQQAM